MWQSRNSRSDRPGQPRLAKLVVVGVSAVAVSALGVTTLLPGLQPVNLDVAEVAAIDESSTTIGFADSDLYGMTPAQIDAHLDQMQAMGVNNVRIMIPWAGVEFYPGYYNWSTVDYMVNAADSRGMGVLGVLNSTPYWAVTPGTPPLSGAPASPAAYGDFAGLVAERYAGKVGAYEIWNEPNGQMFYAPKPDPAGYTELLKAAYPEIKAADPDATVVGGVTGAVVDYGDFTMNPVTFIEGVYDAGGADYFDALSFHPYLYSLPFSEGTPYPESPITQLERMRAEMVANGDADKLIWASEYGQPTSEVDEATQAAYLRDMLTTWSDLGYTGPAFVWTLQDRATGSTDPEDTFGVIRSDGTWKPAAYVIRDLATSASTTPEVARMALAMPNVEQTAAPEDLAVLTSLAATAPVETATAVPALAPVTPMDAMMNLAASSLDASVQAAATSLAQFGQAAATQLAQMNAMVATAMGPTPTVTTADPSPSSIPATSPTLDGLRAAAPVEATPTESAARAVSPADAIPTQGISDSAAPESVLETTGPESDVETGGVAAAAAAEAATPATPASPAAPATPATPAKPATPAAGGAGTATAGQPSSTRADRQQARADRQQARQDRQQARQDRSSDRKAPERKRADRVR